MSNRHVATKIWVNIGSDYGLLPDGTKPLPESMLTYHIRPSEIHLRAIPSLPPPPKKKKKKYLNHQSAWQLLIWNLIQISQGQMS